MGKQSAAASGAAHDDYFVGLDTWQHSRFDPHTDESIWEMVDLLETSVGAIPNPAFADLQQVLGLNYTPEGVLFDRQLRPHLRPRTSVIWDWMHMLVSQGLVLTESAKFITVIKDAGTSCKSLDTFTSQIHGLKGLCHE